MKYLKLLITIVLFSVISSETFSQNKKIWDFTKGLSAETVDNLNADAANWSPNGTDSDGNTNNWQNAVKPSPSEELKANGEVIKETAGLLFDIGNNKSNSIHIAQNKIRLTRANTTITFPKLKNGQKITIVGRSANGTATDRGIKPVQDHIQFVSGERTDEKCIFLGNQVEGSLGTYSFTWEIVTTEPDEVDVQFKLTPNGGIDFIQFIIDKDDPLIIDNIYYILGEKGELTVVKGDIAYNGSVNIPEYVNYNNNIYYVTSIAEKAFQDCHDLTSVIIPNGITSIGENAFYRCENLTEIIVGMTVPPSLTSQIASANRIKLYVPKGTKELYETANYWKEFKEIIEVENIDDYVQGEIFTIPVDLDNGKKVIMTFKVIDAAKKTVQVGDGDSASIVASTEGGLIIPDKVNGYTVTKIGSYAFYYCSNLTSVSIPNTVKTIGNRAFYVCSGLTSLHISASVTSIEDRAFAYCSGLEEIIVDEGNSVYDSRNDCNALIKTSDNTLLIGCKGTVIPSSVKVIAEGAFRGCAELKNIEIPEGVTTIETNAFRGCTGLESVTLPSTITSIGNYAFSAFDEVYNLTTVTVGMNTPVAITSEVFPNRANSTLYVPKGTKVLYETANYWKEFKEIIEVSDEIVFTDISQLDNAIYMDDIAVIPGNRYVLPIKIKNDQSISGYQIDMELPSGMNVALDENGKHMVSMTGRGNGLSFSCKKLSESRYRFVVLSINGDIDSGDDVIMRVSVNVPNGITAGIYGIKFKNGELSSKSGNTLISIKLQDVTTPMSVVDALLGDINGDGTISIVDAVGVVGYVLGDRYDNFITVAADINCDGAITIADVVALVQRILNDDSYAKPNMMFEEE